MSDKTEKQITISVTERKDGGATINIEMVGLYQYEGIGLLRHAIRQLENSED